MALIFGVVNGLIKPIVKLFSLLTMMTLGLFGLVINAGLLLLVAWLSTSSASPSRSAAFPDFRVDAIIAAVIGGIAISIVGRSWWAGGTSDGRLDRTTLAALRGAARPFEGNAGLRHRSRGARRRRARHDGRVSRPDRPPVLGQGERRPRGDRRRHRSGFGANVVSRGEWARRAAPASRTSGSRSRGSARRRPTCVPRRGRRRRRTAPLGRRRVTRGGRGPRDVARRARAAHRRPVSAQPGCRTRDAGGPRRRSRGDKFGMAETEIGASIDVAGGEAEDAPLRPRGHPPPRRLAARGGRCVAGRGTQGPRADGPLARARSPRSIRSISGAGSRSARR